MKYAISVKNLLTKIVAPSIIVRIPFVHRKHARKRRFLFEIMKSVVLVRGCKYSKTSKIVFLKLQTQIHQQILILEERRTCKNATHLEVLCKFCCMQQYIVFVDYQYNQRIWGSQKICRWNSSLRKSKFILSFLSTINNSYQFCPFQPVILRRRF